MMVTVTKLGPIWGRGEESSLGGCDGAGRAKEAKQSPLQSSPLGDMDLSKARLGAGVR